MVAVAACESQRPPGVAARFRFGETPGPDFFPLRQWNNKSVALLFAAEIEDVARTERIMRSHGNADRAIDARQFFDDRHIFGVT